MEDFLTGRTITRTSPKGARPDASKEESGPDPENPPAPEVAEVVHEGPGPRIETVSVEGRVERIRITLPDGQLIELDCHY